jgi:hypothetical protein
VRASLIDTTHTFSIRFEIPNGGFATGLTVTYRAVAGNAYTHQARLDAAECLRAWDRGMDGFGRVVEAIRELSRTMDRWR